jgi:hypothetical protein
VTELALVICPNVAAIGHHTFDPASAPYSAYVQVDCPRCGRAMWLGSRGRIEVETGRAEMLCMLCAVRAGIYRAGSSVTRLTDRDS